MIKLYRKTHDEFVFFKFDQFGHEHTFTWSPLGSIGRVSDRRTAPLSDDAIALQLNERTKMGFLDVSTLPVLVVEFPAVDFGPPEVAGKLARLELLLNETLGSRALGIVISGAPEATLRRSTVRYST